MPEQSHGHPRRTRGSWTPRIAGIILVVLLAGGLALRLSRAGKPAASASPQTRHHHRVSKPDQVASVQSVGLINFGPYDDHDNWRNDPDDHPLMLLAGQSGLVFARIPQSKLTNGAPAWTVNEMADGSYIFIDITTGRCLTEDTGPRLALAHCDLSPRQRWRPVNEFVLYGQAVAQYYNDSDGKCVTAGKHPDHGSAGASATLTDCGPPRTKSQEIAFWWSG